MRKFTLLLALLIFMGFQAVNAQKTITGTVISSEDQMTLPGVSVVVKGTTLGTITDIDGKYSIDVPENATTLVYTYVGMVTEEMAIGANNVIDVSLVPDIMGLDEVVVTALGISREKKSLGYAVQEVGGEDVARAQNVNVINSISGKVSGVQVKNNTNMGGSSNIVIRGQSSLTGSNQVLFVIDGIPINNLNSNNVGQTEGRSGYDYGNPVSDIDPNSIESMSVLKGAAATALYGARAANGVIIITTKKGKKAVAGQKNLTVNLNHSTMFHVMDKSTFPEYQKKYGIGYGPYYSGGDYTGLYEYDFDGDGVDDFVEPTTEDASRGSAYDPNLMIFNWASFYPKSPTYMQKVPYEYASGGEGPESFFETGRTFSTGFDITGGTTVSTYRLGYTNTDMTGIMPNSELKKHNFNFAGSFDLLDNLTVSASANYINNYTKGRNHTGYSDNIMSMFRQWYNLGVDMSLQKEYYDLTGTNMSWNPHDEFDLSPIYWDNPYWARYENYQSDERDRLIGYTQLDWGITDWLDATGRASIDYYTFIQEERKAVGSVAGEMGVDRPDVQSGYARNSYTFSEVNYDFMLKFHKYLTDDLNVHGLVGTNYRKSILDNVFASTNGGIAVPEIYSLNNSLTPMLPPEESYEQTGVFGAFANASLGFKNTFFLDISARNDWSSTLPSDNWSYFYPSVSFNVLFSEMLNNLSWLNLGKVRVNYAKVGNDAPWGRVTDSYRTVSSLTGTSIVRLTRFKNNPDLVPELSTSQEAGLEFAAFDNRVGLDLALYQINTVDQVVPLAVSYVTGFDQKYVNIGEVENKGMELLLRGTPVRTADLSWDIVVNYAKNTNEIISLGDEIENLQLADLQGGVSINAREGEAYGAIQGTGYTYAPDGQKIIMSSGYPLRTGTSDIIIGNIQPDFNAGISNTLSYKGISLNFLIDMQVGGDVFSLDMWYGMATGLYAETAETNDLGNPERDPIVGDEVAGYDATSGGILLDGVTWVDTDGDGQPTEGDTYTQNVKRIRGDNYAADGYARYPNEEFIYDASYVKLRELSLTFNLPKPWLERVFVKNATFSLVGSNLAILHKNLPYADPEASQGAGNIQGWQSGVMPSTKNFGFSLNLQF